MKNYFIILLCTLPLLMTAQLDLKYQTPHEDIMTLADAPLAPAIRINSDNTQAILLYRRSYKTIAELSETEMRLAGLRINPKTNISSRARYYYDMKVFDIANRKEQTVTGLPENARISNVSWSHDQKKVAFTNTTTTGVELWVLDMNRKAVKKLTDANINANMRDAINWMKDDQAILVTLLPSDRKSLIDTETAIPTGPTISVNDGKKAQNRTYQDLLKNPSDEFNFKQLARSEVWKVDLNGKKSRWMETDMYSNISFSPDGNYVMVTTVKEPFSYIVPYYRFPSTTNIYSKDGKLIKNILDVPLLEDLPKGFMSVRKGPRSMAWRADKAATLYWAEALDGGDPANEVEFRDAVYELDAPFDGEKQMLMKTKERYSGIQWGNDELAVCYNYWWNSRNLRIELFNPSDASQAPTLFSERNYQDRYNDPGSFVSDRNEFGRSTLEIVDGKLYLLGDGYSEDGKHPFIDEYNIKMGGTKRLYQSKNDEKLETLIRAIDIEKGTILTRLESKNEYPNYYVRNIKNDDLTAVTTFKNPFKEIQDVHKEVITYQREDGVELSATLYLPVGYDKNKKEKMPMIMWAYPREFKDKSSAGQVTSSSNEFTYPWYGSPLFWVNRGYVVLDDAAFPIIGEGKEEPNDSFIPQLVGNAKAAIDAVDKMGYIDRNRVAVGGHSYGAFMTANLLTHSDLFAAGIARSGAYNRTLTPFGFQAEERNYWEAPNIYYEMSPFMHADKMKTPLLLLHGQADNNSGTYPMQSERYFNALKGLGATVRLVMLPKESHGYAARESILHMLWEQDQWLDKYVKNRKMEVEMEVKEAAGMRE
ncbi:MAG: prolyl oligopeptidase family serine peptidase [Bacteroidota bacterium]